MDEIAQLRTAAPRTAAPRTPHHNEHRMPLYERRQVGRTLIFISIAQGAIGLALLAANVIVGLALVVVAVLTAWLFTSMTVVVTDDDVAWHFGPGIVERRLSIADIRAVRVVRLPWYSGIGIHLTANGWLYNVASGPVVQIERQDGGCVNVGSPEPAAVRDVIAARMRAPQPPHVERPHAHGVPWPVLSVIVIGLAALALAILTWWDGGHP